MAVLKAKDVASHSFESRTELGGSCRMDVGPFSAIVTVFWRRSGNDKMKRETFSPSSHRRTGIERVLLTVFRGGKLEICRRGFILYKPNVDANSSRVQFVASLS